MTVATSSPLKKRAAVSAMPLEGFGEHAPAVQAALRDKALPFLLDPEPDCLLVCSGYDALEPDPLATMTLQPSDFARSVDAILARYPRTRVALGLEGGYALGAGGMPEAFTETCRALVDGA